MDSLHEVLVQSILSHVCNARDVASCLCTSNRWKESLLYIKCLSFPRLCFGKQPVDGVPESTLLKFVQLTVGLEELQVYSPFSSKCLASCLSHSARTLRRLELRMDCIHGNQDENEISMKINCIAIARNLEVLNLWGIKFTESFKWDSFERLQRLEMVMVQINNETLSSVLQACPNLTHLSLISVEGVSQVSIELEKLKECKLHFSENCILYVTSTKLECLDIHYCSWIRALHTDCLKNLSIVQGEGTVDKVFFQKLSSLEFLNISGSKWCWDAISNLLNLASEVRHLHMRVEYTGGEFFLPFPEIDIVEFFNSHPKLEKFEIHGAMFAALRYFPQNGYSRFEIPCLEEVVITVRSPLNPEQKLKTLESLLKYAKNLKKMVLRISNMSSELGSADYFFHNVHGFYLRNKDIVVLD